MFSWRRHRKGRSEEDVGEYDLNEALEAAINERGRREQKQEFVNEGENVPSDGNQHSRSPS